MLLNNPHCHNAGSKMQLIEPVHYCIERATARLEATENAEKAGSATSAAAKKEARRADHTHQSSQWWHSSRL
jgi:hypothetical protein